MARPKGSTTKPRITEYMTVDEIEGLVKLAKKQAEKNPIILKFLLEQVYGKAPQTMDVTSGGEKVEGVIMYPQTNGKENKNSLETSPKTGNSAD